MPVTGGRQVVPSRRHGSVAGVVLEVGARRAVYRASRASCSRCTCTDARTDAVLPYLRRRHCRVRRQDCSTSSELSGASCVSQPHCDGRQYRTPSSNENCNNKKRYTVNKISFCHCYFYANTNYNTPQTNFLVTVHYTNYMGLYSLNL